MTDRREVVEQGGDVGMIGDVPFVEIAAGQERVAGREVSLYTAADRKKAKPPRLNCAVYCMPAFSRPPPSVRSHPENLSTLNRFVSS